VHETLHLASHFLMIMHFDMVISSTQTFMSFDFAIMCCWRVVRSNKIQPLSHYLDMNLNGVHRMLTCLLNNVYHILNITIIKRKYFKEISLVLSFYGFITKPTRSKVFQILLHHSLLNYCDEKFLKIV
jgi:hypothetical protein